jgi:hypothetical protein
MAESRGLGGGYRVFTPVHANGNPAPRRWCRAARACSPRATGEKTMATETNRSSGSWRTGSYVGAIVANVVLLYVARHLLAWRVPFVTAAWADVLWAVELSLYVAIVGNAVLLSYDPTWLRHGVEVAQGLFGLQAAYWVWALYPFAFGPFDELARLLMLLVLVGLAIGVVVAAITTVVELVRESVRAPG